MNKFIVKPNLSTKEITELTTRLIFDDGSATRSVVVGFMFLVAMAFFLLLTILSGI